MSNTNTFDSEILYELYVKTFNSTPGLFIKLKGDGSDRQIYRLGNDKQSVIGIVGQQLPENRAFIAFSRHFTSHGLPVPKILAVDPTETAYLESDLGDTTLFDRIQQEPKFNGACLALYERVLDWLPRFQISAGQDLDYSYCYQHIEFGQEAMTWDFNYFCDRFLGQFYTKEYDLDQLQNDFSTLLIQLLEPTRNFFLYRDFQSRNIMLYNEKPFYIDYQSGRRGALQYDLASLLFDAKAGIPQQAREHLIKYYISKVREIIPFSASDFMHYFYAYVWIRIMQAMGAYGYLSQVKGKPKFLASIPPALHNIKTLLGMPTIMDDLLVLKSIFIDLVNDNKLYQLGKI